MVTESTEKTRQNSARPAFTPGVAGIGRSPMRPSAACQATTAPIARQITPGTMKAARHEASVISTPGTTP